MEKYKLDEYRCNDRFTGRPRPNPTNHMLTTQGREYVESSHRSILARGRSAVLWDAPQHATQPPSSQGSDGRRSCTPAPSLSSDTMSLRSANTISPVTPSFDIVAHPSSVSGSSHRRQPMPLDFSRLQLQTDMDRPVRPFGQANFDPASTYQPRRMMITNSSRNGSQPTPTSASTNETSFIDWDDDPSRFQRVKQSLTLQRPHQSNNASQAIHKNPDRYLNAVPRIPFRTKSNSTQQSRSGTPQPAAASPIIHTPQQRSPLVRAPASFDQPRYKNFNLSIPTRPPPVSRYSEDTRIRPQYPTDPPRQTNQQSSLIAGSRTRALPAVQSHTSRSDTTNAPPRQPPQQHRSTTGPKLRHHDQLERASSTLGNKDTTPPLGKPKRFMNMMHGVMERVSIRDLKKEAGKGK